MTAQDMTNTTQGMNPAQVSTPNTTNGAYQVSGGAFPPADQAMPTSTLPTTPPFAPQEPVDESIPPVLDAQTAPMTTAPVEEPKKEEPKDDGKKSPLEALAEKLAQLKSELVEEVPDEKKSQEASTPQFVETPPTSTPTSEEQKKEEVDTDTQIQGEINSMIDSAMQKASTPTDTISSPTLDMPIVPPTLSTPVVNEQPKIETPAVTDTFVAPQLPDTPAPVVETPKEEVPTFPAQPMVPEVPASTPTVQPEVKSDNPTVGDILSQYQTEIQTDSPAVTEPETTLPTPAVASMGSSNVEEDTLDENANAQVSDEQVEQKTATGGKYPMGINKVLDIAIERDASDVLISVGYPVMIRIDGTLVEVDPHIVSGANAEELILPVLTEQKKELLEVNKEVDLGYTHQHGGEARFRINAFYTRANLAAAFRLIPSRIKTIQELNLPAIYTQFASLKQGLILVTGPTGHGKSTTLAAIIQEVNANRAVHVLTIEDPIEYIFPKLTAVVDQREMHDDTHSWPIALKSALRQNPDVILVGEMRDYETIAATITLAETGHLVFATLHTNSASQSIDRIIDVFPENQQAQVRTQLSNILEAVIAQRLIPIEGGGRRAVSEILIGTPAVRNLIREGNTHQLDNVIRTSADVGMVSLESSLVKLVREGLITMEKAQEFAVNPEEVVRLLKG